MQFTLWQQFSSNHSAAYTIVGVFPTPDYAEAAYVKLRAILLMLADDKGGSQNSGGMTAAEIEIAEQSKIDWQEGLDWIPRMHADPKWRMPPYSVDDAVTRYDRLVFVSAPGASFTWQTGHQFAALMQRMDGAAFQNIYMGSPPNPDNPNDKDIVYEDIYFTISCRAASEAIAGEIEQILNEYLLLDQSQKYKHPMPWAIYHPHAAHIAPRLSPANYAEAEQQFFQEKRNGTNPIWSLRNDTHLLKGKCQITGTRIEISDVQFVVVDTVASFHALCAWLKARGCTNLTYTLRQASPTANG